MRTTALLFALAVLASLPLWAQASPPETPASTAPPQSMNAPDEASKSSAPQQPLPEQELPKIDQSQTSDAEVPAHITGASSNSISTGYMPTSFLRGGLGGNVIYDDNVSNSSDHRLRDVVYSLGPEFEIRHQRQKVLWDFDYLGEFAFDQRSSTRDEVRQSIASGFEYDLSRHLRLSLRQTYDYTNTPFMQNGFVNSNFNSEASNDWAIIPTANRSSAVTFADLGWRFRQHSIVGISGFYNRLRFAETTVGPAPFPSDARNLQAYVGQRVNKRNSVGMVVQFRYLTTPAVTGDNTWTSGVQLFETFSPREDLSVSVYGGPQTRHSRTVMPDFSITRDSSGPYFAGGAALEWHKAHRFLRVSYDDGTTDGGGIARAVRLRVGGVDGQVSITRRLLVHMGFGVGDSEVLDDTTGAAQHFRTMSAKIRVERHLISNVWLTTQYDQIRQSQAASTALNIGRNRIQMGIIYRFARPLGISENEQ